MGVAWVRGSSGSTKCTSCSRCKVCKRCDFFACILYRWAQWASSRAASQNSLTLFYINQSINFRLLTLQPFLLAVRSAFDGRRSLGEVFFKFQMKGCWVRESFLLSFVQLPKEASEAEMHCSSGDEEDDWSEGGAPSSVDDHRCSRIRKRTTEKHRHRIRKPYSTGFRKPCTSFARLFILCVCVHLYVCQCRYVCTCIYVMHMCRYVFAGISICLWLFMYICGGWSILSSDLHFGVTLRMLEIHLIIIITIIICMFVLLCDALYLCVVGRGGSLVDSAPLV